MKTIIHKSPYFALFLKKIGRGIVLKVAVLLQCLICFFPIPCIGVSIYSFGVPYDAIIVPYIFI